MLLTSHGQVLFYVATHSDARIPQIASAVGVSQRRVGSILRDLCNDGMLRIIKVGRRNTYEVNPEARFRHPSMAHMRLADVLDRFAPHVVDRGASV
jgi:hypothetical protein